MHNSCASGHNPATSPHRPQPEHIRTAQQARSHRGRIQAAVSSTLEYGDPRASLLLDKIPRLGIPQVHSRVVALAPRRQRDQGLRVGYLWLNRRWHGRCSHNAYRPRTQANLHR